MNRREFVHITALGSAAGVMSFTGLGLVWNDDVGRDAPPPDAGTDSPSDTATPSPTEERSPRSPTRTSSDDSSTSPTATDSEVPTATATESPQGTGGTTTSSTPGQTGTPDPSQNVESDFTWIDDNQEVYVKLENGNPYAVDITITITWGYDDGTTATKVRTVQLEADAFWSDSIYRDAEGRTVERWGNKLDVEKH